ncbi:MAG TPA: lactate utilization protein [Pyrinomonadaceae bacterium]
MIEPGRNNSARESILASIREHLAASAPHDAIHAGGAGEKVAQVEVKIPQSNGSLSSSGSSLSLVEIFKEKLEAVGGHCIVAHSDRDVIEALNHIIQDLQKTPLGARRISLSNSPALERLLSQTTVNVDEVVSSPGAAELFGYDIGISTAQAAIAETGTLVLESESEKHRLVSLVPPVHIAIVEAGSICLTLGEALARLQGSEARELSATITFITGPSRTADIELTLAIGVHGPQELYVIVNGG